MDSSRNAFLSRVIESLNRKSSIARSTASSRSLTGKESDLESIVIASKDPKFSKVSKVVGRENELKELMQCFDRMLENSKLELVVIHGKSGSGKSSVVQAFAQHNPSEVLFVQGKFDQLQNHVPYSGLVAAANDICRQILKQPNSDEIRNRIREFLGPEIYLLKNLIPSLVEVVKDQKKDHDVVLNRLNVEGSMVKAFTRFKLLFRSFLRSVASPQNPLIFFLDDLQWADTASLEVLKSIVTDRFAKNIMILCAYREGEMPTDVLKQYHLIEDDVGTTMVDGSIPLSSGASGYCAHVTDIAIECLNVIQLNELLSFKLAMNSSSTESLSQLIWNKTNGNPFYALNFLEMLYRKNLLFISTDDEWTWDESQILRSTNVSDNLLSILESKVQSLSEQVRSILQMASFIGHEFPLSILVTIVHEEQDIIESDYSFQRISKQVIRERIISSLKIAVEEGLLEKTDIDDDYKFAHDKIQEVLYETLMPDETERQLLHQRIGTLIWDNVKDNEKSQIDDWFVFLAADNLNRALSMVDYSGDKYYLIELNLIAAKRTIQKSALLLAAGYLRIAVDLVLRNEICWSERYDLCLEVFNTAAEIEKNVGCHTRCADLIAVIHQHAKYLHHRCTAFVIEMDSMTVQGHLEESILLGLSVLRKLGIKFPNKIGTFILVKELIAAKTQLGKRKLRELISLPEINDEKLLFSFLILNATAFNAFLLGDAYKEAYATLCVRMFRLTLKYGISRMYSPLAIMSWANLNVYLGRFDDAFDSEKLAFDLIDKFGIDSLRGTVISVSYGSSHFWREKLDSESRHELLLGYQMSLSYGDIHLAQFGVVGWVVAAIYIDDKLSDIHPKTRSVVSEMQELDCMSSLILLLPNWQVVSTFLMTKYVRLLNTIILTMLLTLFSF
jgi:predicted ATPase